MSNEFNQQLLKAAKNGDLRVMQAALKNGAEIDCQDGDGKTALMWAAHHGKIEAARCLLEKGANPALRDNLERNAVFWAYSFQQPGKKFFERGISWEMDQLIKSQPRYREDSAVQIKAARDFTIRLAKEFRVKIKRNDLQGRPGRLPGLNMQSRVVFHADAVFEGMANKWLVEPDGFQLWIRNFRGPAVSFLLSCGEFPCGQLRQGWGKQLTVPPLRGSGLVCFSGRNGDPQATEHFFENTRNIADLKTLGLQDKELLVISSKQIRFHCRTTDLTLIRSRLEAVARLFHRNKKSFPGPFIQREFDVKIGAELESDRKDSVPHQFGGRLPYSVSCPACGEPASLIARICLGASLPPANKFNRRDFPVLWCLDCCDWGPLFFELSKKDVTPCGGKKKLPAKQKKFSESDLEACALSLTPLKGTGNTNLKSKLGGMPTWVQNDGTPECCMCGQGMKFVVQLANCPQISFADAGMLYAFVCPDCNVAATLIQSR